MFLFIIVWNLVIVIVTLAGVFFFSIFSVLTNCFDVSERYNKNINHALTARADRENT